MLGSIPTKTTGVKILVTSPDGSKTTTKVYQTSLDEVATAINDALKANGADCKWESPKKRTRRAG